MSVMHICDSSFFLWPGTLRQSHWLCCLPLVEYHNELIREQMPTDQKMKCEQWTPFPCLASLSEPQPQWPSWLALGSLQQVGVSLLSEAQLCSCMQAKGRWWIRVQRQVFHVASCCAGAGSQSICGGCQRAQMSLKSPGGRCNQSQLSSGASPRFEYSLLLFSPPHQGYQGFRLSISSYIFLMKPSMKVYRWQSLTLFQGKGFYSFPAWIWRSRH